MPLVLCVAGSGESSPTENRGPQRAQGTGTEPCYVSQARTEAEISSGESQTQSLALKQVSFSVFLCMNPVMEKLM